MSTQATTEQKTIGRIVSEYSDGGDGAYLVVHIEPSPTEARLLWRHLTRDGFAHCDGDLAVAGIYRALGFPAASRVAAQTARRPVGAVDVEFK